VPFRAFCGPSLSRQNALATKKHKKHKNEGLCNQGNRI